MAHLIGLLHSGSRGKFLAPVRALKLVLKPFDIKIKTALYADDDDGVLDDYAEELVKDGTLEAIIAAGGPDPALRLQHWTKRLAPNRPVVFTTVANPKASGLVDELHAPGFNLTGMAGRTSELDSERARKLVDLLRARPVPPPPQSKIGVLVKHGRNRAENQYDEVRHAIQDLDLRPRKREVNTVSGIKKAFDFFKNEDVRGLVVMADSFFNNNRDTVVAHATNAGIPAIFQWKEFVEEGGLISHAPDITESYKKAGEFVKRIVLDRESPATMACSTPTSVDTYVNEDTALAFGITVPEKLSDQPVHVI